jgi:SPFH domain / Band 7 family
MGGLAGIAILIGLIWRFGFGGADKQRILVLEYQRGVKLTEGKITAVLEPGQWRINKKKDRVDIVDMRPQPFIFEALACEDKMGTRVLLSLAGEFAVGDARLALMSSRDDANAGPARISKVTRETVSKLGLRDTTDATLALLHTTLLDALNRDLGTIGLETRNIEITELWTAAIRAATQEFKQ